MLSKKKNIISPISEAEYENESKRNGNGSRPIQRVYNNNTKQASSLLSVKKNRRSVVINESPVFARFSVLYLGTAIASADQRGIDSVQEPLSKRYPVDGGDVVRGIEVWLSVNENDVRIQFTHDPSILICYPIHSLVYCAGLRFTTRSETGEKLPNGWRFVRIDSPEADQIDNIHNPPTFSITFRRTRHSAIDECHCFLAKNKQTALAFVQACYDAFQATDPEQNCSKVPLYYKLGDNNQSEVKHADNEIRIVAALDHEQTLDYQMDSKYAGFFYKTDQISIDYWRINEHQKQGAYQSSNSHSYSLLPSYLPHRPSAITSGFDAQQSSSETESISIATDNNQPLIDPYPFVPKVTRAERIKVPNSGRNIFIQEIGDTSEVPKQIPPPHLGNNIIYVDLNAGHEFGTKIPDEIERILLNDNRFTEPLVFNNQPQYYKPKKPDKKHKYRNSEIVNNVVDDRHGTKTNKKHTEAVNPPDNSLFQQQLYMPSYSSAFPPYATSFTYDTTQFSSQPNYNPTYWYFSM